MTPEEEIRQLKQEIILLQSKVTHRPVVPFMENLLKEDHFFKCLNHGHVRLIDYMGDQSAIIQAARVSYGKGTQTLRKDRGLLRYLMRHRHSTPSEMATLKVHMKMPIFVARQIVRHRTACLTGDMNISFDLPGGKTGTGAPRHYPLTIKDIYNRWHGESATKSTYKHKPTNIDKVDLNAKYLVSDLSKLVDRSDIILRKLIRDGDLKTTQNRPYKVLGSAWKDYCQTPKTRPVPNKKERIKSMQTRSLNEKTGEIYYTKIKDIWSNGIKDIIRVEFSNGTFVRATKDHLFFTSEGWMKLEDALLKNVKFFSSGKKQALKTKKNPFSAEELKKEIWTPILMSNNTVFTKYEVSSLGRIRNLQNTRGNLLENPKIKTPTITPSGYEIVSLSENSTSRAYLVHHLVLNAFVGLRENNQETRHLNRCPTDNRLSNLKWGSSKENAKDRLNHKVGDQTLSSVEVAVVSWKHDGREEVFDIEVEGPYHNFYANGIVVHNSLNEISGRYSILPEEFYFPDADHVAVQSKNNKQGRGKKISQKQALEVIEILKADAADCYQTYEMLADEDGEYRIARELARINLTLNCYTEWYWKMDLHNLMHFLSLRLHPHAQLEARVYAEAVAEIVQGWVPFVWEAFEDYRLNASFLSGPETELIKLALQGEPLFNPGNKMSGRERKAFYETWGIRVPKGQPND